MSITITTEDKTITALLEGEIDHHTAGAMRQEIDSAVIRMEPELLKLDFSRVGFMDSSGVGLIMGRFRLMKETGGSVEVINVPAGMAKMMKMAGLSRLGIKGIE